MRPRGFAIALIALLGAANFALADTPPRLLRVVGETVSPPPGMPARFVIDAMVEVGDDPFKAEIDGWLATLGENGAGGDLDGTCVESRCALSVSLGYEKLAISADLAGPTPGSGRVVLTDRDDRVIEAQVRFTAIAGPVAGLGDLAAPDAVRSLELTELLMWNGGNPGFSNARDEPVDWMQRGALAEWQAAAGRPGGGLILVEDLDVLRREAAAAKTAAGWTRIEGAGWSAGYPAALLPIVETVGPERRFASRDGKLRLVIAVDPPMSDEAWDAFVDQTTEDKPGIERRGYTRVNDDMEINWIEKGRFTSAAYHNRSHALGRLEYSYPEDAPPEGDLDMSVILQRSFRMDDAPSEP